MSGVWPYLSVIALTLTGLLLIFIILLQRGRGGGLAGAFGGAGGQSALGTKAGDVFTRITVGLAVFWVFLSCLSIYSLRAGSEGRLSLPGEDSAAVAPLPGEADPLADEEEERATGATGAGTTRAGIEGGPPVTGTSSNESQNRPGAPAGEAEGASDTTPPVNGGSQAP